MDKAAYNRLLSLSDIQLGPQKLNFAVTKIVTVLIFGIFCPPSHKEARNTRLVLHKLLNPPVPEQYRIAVL